MTRPASAEKLYTPDVLGLAVELARYPLDDSFAAMGHARSLSCGSTVDMGIDYVPESGIRRIGMRVAACAIGQASAALFAREAAGQPLSAIEQAMHGVSAWLAGESDAEPWPGLDRVAAARDYPGRHGAVLLPWRAALDALSKAGSER